MNVFYTPIDKEDKRICCDCGKKATLVELFSGKFYCNACTQKQANTFRMKEFYRSRFNSKK